MKIGFLGIGLMGRPMAERLLKAGHQVWAYNRTREKALPLQELGARVVATPVEAIAPADCVILMLADGQAIEEVLFNQPESIPFANRTVIQMGTILPKESRSFQKRIEKAGGEYLEAPVLGSTPQATEGKLIVMVGGTSTQFERWKQLLSVFGSEPVHIGAVSKAAALKLALNQLIAALSSSFSLSLGIVLREKIDVEVFMKILRKSAFYAPTFDKKLPLMLSRDFSNPHFPTKHLLKDVRLIIAEAESLGLETEVIEAVRRVIEKTLQAGYTDTDYSSLYSAINPTEN